MHFQAVLFSKDGRFHVTVLNPDGSVALGTPDFSTRGDAVLYADGLDAMARITSNGHTRCLLKDLPDEVTCREYVAALAPKSAS